MFLVTPEQMKFLEAESDKRGISYSQLMENAGRDLAKYIKRNCADKDMSVLFLCGKGNNAGDCFVASRYLAMDNWKVYLAMLCGSPKTEIAKSAFERANAACILWEYDEIMNFIRSGKYSIAADGVFGTGFHGELPENIKKAFSEVKGIKIAVDVPSGGDCGTGQVSDGTFRADSTLTFAYRKFGMAQYPLISFCGDIEICDIGISKNIEYPGNRIKLITDKDVKNIIPKKSPDAHKGRFGRLLTVCGSRKMPGACYMSAAAAARCGAGLIITATVAENIPIISSKLPEIMFEPLMPDEDGFIDVRNADAVLKAAEKCTAVLIGCGIGVTDGTKALVEKLIMNLKCPIILDADGINCICERIDIIRETRSGIILTPHPAEMSRLSGVSVTDIQSDRLGSAQRFAEKYGVSVVLKGAGTIISGDGRTYVNLTGNPGMGKGGSGDILSGMIASFAAQGISLMDSAVLSVFLHGKAGDRAAEKLSMQSMLPTDMLNELPGLLKEIEM